MPATITGSNPSEMARPMKMNKNAQLIYSALRCVERHRGEIVYPLGKTERRLVYWASRAAAIVAVAVLLALLWGCL